MWCLNPALGQGFYLLPSFFVIIAGAISDVATHFLSWALAGYLITKRVPKVLYDCCAPEWCATYWPVLFHAKHRHFFLLCWCCNSITGGLPRGRVSLEPVRRFHIFVMVSYPLSKGERVGLVKIFNHWLLPASSLGTVV